MTNRIVVVLSMIMLLSTVGAAQEVSPVISGATTVASQQDNAGLYKEEEEESSPLDRKVSIRVSNVPISVFLNSITTQAKVNFIMSEEFANKKVTASLTRVTVREALDTLLRVHGLAYQRIGKSDSYVVTKRSNDAPDTITKIYTLSYISLQELNGGGSSDMASSLSGSSSGGLGGSIGGGSSISTIIQSMLSPVGKIAIDPRTNKLIITDVPEVFPQIENILAELDIRPPQILIEAQIVEVNKTSGLSLGFEYGGSGGTMLEVTAPTRSLYSDFFHRKNILGEKFHGWNWIFPSQQEVAGDSTTTQTTSEGGVATNTETGDTEAGVLNWSAFNIVLHSLLTRGEAKYLGKPKVVTLNNQQATIQANTDATVGQVMNQSGSGSGQGMTTVSPERKSVGLTLNVTPQVNREGYVTLLVEPTYSDVISSGFDFSKDTTSRSAKTLVRVKNGQTVVIGGLLSSRELDQTRKVPLLGDIPILGWLFTSKTKSKSTTDLVIFITPTILAE